jgi:hypothetical protein
MRIAVRHRNFMVIDDFVETARFELLRESLLGARYQPRTGSLPLWSLSEVRWVRSSPFTSDSVTRDFGDPATVAYFIFVDAFHRALAEMEYLTGPTGETWDHYNGNAVVFPPNGALNWHRDRRYAASYSFYWQRAWDRRWGGELLLLEEDGLLWGGDDDPRDEDPQPVADIGYFITPIGNRVVVIRGNTPHRISAVSPAAGEKHRVSITGFFLQKPPRRSQ